MSHSPRVPGLRYRPRVAVAGAALLLVLAPVPRHAVASEAGPGVDAPVPSPGTDAAPRTNIVVFLADDLGFSDLGCYGGEIPTPNIDALASEGLRFTNFYNTGRCSPTRASLLTGLYPHQVGLGGVINEADLDGGSRALDDRGVTIAEVLRDAGYRTLMVGKWHLGHERPHWPLDRGFDRFYGSPRSGGFYFRPAAESLVVLDETPVELDADWYATERFGDQAVRFLREAGDDGRPFFLYVAFLAPHAPLQARPEAIERDRGRYRSGWEAVRRARFGRMVDLGIADRRWRLLPAREVRERWQSLGPEERADVDERMATYAAQVETMDGVVGQVMQTVRSLGVDDDTLVLFLSDNGASSGGGMVGFRRGDETSAIGSPESFASYGLGWARVSNTPLHGFKRWVTEGGVATPLVVRWPERIARRGELEAQPGHVIDVLPTCLEAAGVPYPTTYRGHPILPPEGKSLLPAFDGSVIPRDGLYWEHLGNRAVRMGKWKLSGLRDEEWHLYNLETDRTETLNLAGVYPDRVNDMARAYEAWAERVGVVRWEPDDDFVPDEDAE